MTSLEIILAITLLILICIFIYTLYYSWQNKIFFELSKKELELLKEQIYKNEQQLKQQEDKIKISDDELSKAKAEIEKTKVQYKEREKNYQEQIDNLKSIKEEMTNQFKIISKDIISKETSQFKEDSQYFFSGMINPVKENISKELENVKKHINEFHTERTKTESSLLQQIKNLGEQTNTISQEAKDLTQALKGDKKKQGSWGEMHLKIIMENSGLREGYEYELQSKFSDGENDKIPDAIIHLPNQRDIIIDSKVTLNSFIEMDSSRSSQTQDDTLWKKFRSSVEHHIKGLSSKSYQNIPGKNTLDFILMFIPLESAFLAICERELHLFNEALLRHKIAIVGPTTLITTLRLIENLWRLEKQSKNAEKIASETGKLYDKLVSFIDTFEKIGYNARKLQESYESSYKLLTSGRGNIVSKAQNIKTLGIRNTKEIPKDISENSLEN